MLVPLDEWAASSAATIEIVQFPCETPRGGLLDFRKIGLAPAPKTWPKTVFETKLLIDFMFFEGKKYGPTAPTRCQNDYRLQRTRKCLELGVPPILR